MIEFYGYVNGQAIAVNNHKNLINIFYVLLLPAIILSVFAILFYPLAMIVIWLAPALFLIFSYLAFAFQRYDDKYFLAGTKKVHTIRMENGCVYVDKKQCKHIKKCLLYKYKKYILFILNDRFYLVPNEAYTVGGKNEFFLLFKRQVLNKFVLKSKS
ncbi:MAG TPA: hypothetical protein IAB69_04445 [Candidatus Coproplasma excrementigallinarum]|uniref:Uncharacterized protein n=1 Tax=Candidatus Coproplasma excrementigallinarum TaxID=2840747 RepID=A0A9D1MKR4_9FIRM|nr:hypothetical protein [Candidatus Coproplasma excrementigallinarum]